LNKKIILIISIILLLFAGIIALTQELDFLLPDTEHELSDEEEDIADYMAIYKKPARWFNSNVGGMALQETQSRLVALRSEYALAIDTAFSDELPEYLLSYYNEEFLIEVRMLYKNSEQIRTQWLFRDENHNTRLNAVFLEIDGAEEQSNIERSDVENSDMDHPDYQIAIKGFIEIFDEKLNLISEYKYYEDGNINKTDFIFNDDLLINSTVSVWEEGEYKKRYTDSYRYNRSLSLRGIERMFHSDIMASHDDLVRITFHRRLMDAVHDKLFISERLNIYPDFFGNVFIKGNTRMIFETDDRGRIFKQTLYDEEEEIIWVINNTWQDNRIVSTLKTEGDSVLLAEFQYNSAGDRILERNLKNGTLERLVRADGIYDIEELYMNNVVVLRAVWEEGRKISETRVR